MIKALVIGCGSIGSRHLRILGELGCQVATLSKRTDIAWPRYSTIGEALSQMKPDYVVIANNTASHHAALSELAALQFKGTVLVEKPLFHEVLPLPANSFRELFVAYNLRFHPVLCRCRELIGGSSLLSAQLYVGQYLPQWRPTQDYRGSYSALLSEGGGVMRDLSHELDWMLWIFGSWTAVAAVGGHLSDLAIETEDVCSLLIKCVRCPAVTVELNYLDHIGKREFTINTGKTTIHGDLINNIINVDGQEERFELERDTTYHAEHQAILDGRYDNLCSGEQGLAVVELIHSVEIAMSLEKWVTK